MFTMKQPPVPAPTAADDEPDYFMTSSFIARVINSIILLTAWIVAVIAIDNNSAAATQIQVVRMTFLVVAVIAFVECVTILVICLSSYACNILIGIFIAVDVFLGLFLAAVSTAAVTRDMLVQRGQISSLSYRSGSFTAMAILGFISVVLYVELVILYIKYIIVQMNNE